MSRRRPASKRRTGEPISIRLDRATDQLVSVEARRTRRSKSAVVSAFTEETARTRRFPGIGFRGDDASRRAWVIGSGLDVWEIVQMLEDFGGVERLLAAVHHAQVVALELEQRRERRRAVAVVVGDQHAQRSDLRVLLFGTRGGLLVNHVFPSDGEYTVTITPVFGDNMSPTGFGTITGEKLEVLLDGQRLELMNWQSGRGGQGLAIQGAAVPLWLGVAD